MGEIVRFMALKGYHSRTYYDLFNSLVDAELAEMVLSMGRRAYQLKSE